MESIHFRHPGGTPEDEADALNAPRATSPHTAAKVAAALSEPHAQEAMPPSQLVARTAAAAAAGAVLATLSNKDAPAQAAADAARELQPQRGLSPQVAALCAFAAACSLLLHAGSVLEGAGSWLLLTLFLCWVAHREMPVVAAAWVVATCFLGAAVAGR
jgi:hypothetical protein